MKRKMLGPVAAMVAAGLVPTAEMLERAQERAA